MNNLYLSFSVVFPLFCMMALGYLLRVIQLFNDDFLKQLNQLCFKVFLPVLLFINIYKSDFQTLFSAKLVLFAVAGITGAFILLMLCVPLFEKNAANCGVIIQGIFRSNFILFGIPISASLYGSENTSVTAILLAFVIPLFNLLSIIALDTFSKKKNNPFTVLKGVFKNPLILGSILAFFFVLTGIRLPDIAESAISDLAKAATPLSLIILGGSFQFRNLQKYTKPLIFSICGKLLLMPLLFLPLSVLAGFRDLELTALLAMFASPTAVSTFTMAQNANANEELSGQIVILDSLLSIGTIFLWITVLKHNHLI